MFLGALILAFTPGFDVLGHYSALAASLLTSALVGPATIELVQQARLHRTPLPDVIRRALGNAVFLVLIGAGVLTLNALRVKNCDLPMGLGFWILGPVITAAFSAIMGVMCGTLLRRRALAIALYFTLIVVSFALLLVHFLTGPTVTAYSPFFGHLSGAVYDDVIPITPTWLLYRLNNVVQALCMLALMRWLVEPSSLRWDATRARRLEGGSALLFGMLLAFCLLFHLERGAIGYERSHADVREALDGRTETPHFIVHHPTSDESLSREVPWIVHDLEYRFAQLETELGASPTQLIHVHLYGSGARKRRLMGADKVSIAKPWLGEVHLGPTHLGDPLIKHELAHVFAAEFAPGPLHVSASFLWLPHMALIEGLAKAVEGHRSRLDLHQWSAAMDALDILPDLDRLLGPGGYTGSHGPTAYTAAGSFFSHLLETRGSGPVRDVYASRNFETAFGEELADLQAEWMTRLRDPLRTPVAEADLEWARNRFDRKPILQRVCPLVVAGCLRDASIALKSGEAEAALESLEQALDHREGAPRIRLQRLSALAQLQEWDAVASDAEDLLTLSNLPLALQLSVEERRGDAHWAQGERAQAAHRYVRVTHEAVSPTTLRRMALKLALVRGTPGPLEKELLTLLLQKSKLKDRVDTLKGLREKGLNSPLLDYLHGRHLHALRLPQDAVPLLREALRRGLPHPLLNRRAHRDLAQSLWMLGEWDLATRHFEWARKLTPDTERGTRARLADWIERCAWSKARGAHARRTSTPERIQLKSQDDEWNPTLGMEHRAPLKERGETRGEAWSSRIEQRPCADGPRYVRLDCAG